MLILAAFLLSSNIFLMVHASDVQKENDALRVEVKTLNGSADVSKGTLKDKIGND